MVVQSLTHLVLALCAFACTQTGTKASPLEEMSADVIVNVFKMSMQDCIDNCESRADCLQVKYYRRYHLCQMLKDHDPTQHIGAYIYTKSPIKVADHKRACENCTHPNECIRHHDGDVADYVLKCTTQRCQLPDHIRGSAIDGNMFTIGSQVKLGCISGEYFILECQANGTWTNQNLTCPCFPREVPSGYVTLSSVGRDLVQADIECQDGHTLFDPVSPICNTTTGIWTPSFNEVCCDVLRDGDWQKIFRFQGNTPVEIFPWWRSAETDAQLVKRKCTYRNTTILQDWNGAVDLNRVKFNVIKDEQVVAYVIFNAPGSDNLNWFEKDRVIESSWTDLGPETDLDVFSIRGDKIKDLPGKGKVRFFIGKTVEEETCDRDLGWLAITWKVYPCNALNATDDMKIVYSPLDTVTEMTYGNVDIADRIEVFITQL